MVATRRISLFSAILININVIVGAGVFLNVKPLNLLAGRFGFLGYLFGALLLFPFIISLSKLAAAQPFQGGIYLYSKKHLSPFIGFISGWSYFIGKTVSAAFLVHAFTSFFQGQLPFLQSYPPVLLSSIVIFVLITSNLKGLQIGSVVQIVFFIMKLIPLLAITLFGLFFVTTTSLPTISLSLSPLFSTIPIALYALMGFEIICSIGHLIKQPEKNFLRAMLGSFVAVVVSYVLFQSASFFAQGQTMWGQNILTMLIFTAVLAGAFGILTSNCWNLQALAQDNFLPGSNILKKVSNNNVPSVSLALQAGIAILLLIMTENQIALQSMSVFGVVLSFLLTAIAALVASYNNHISLHPLFPLAAIMSCCFMLFLCFQKIAAAGISIPYIILLGSGILLANFKRQKR